MMKYVIAIYLFMMMQNIFAVVNEQSVRLFVDTELKYYPCATLVDLYKNYFQDAYGPGHLINDVQKAGEYLDRELSHPDWSDTVMWQPLGVRHDYYRVNLLYVKNGVIPRDTLLLGMQQSAMLTRNPKLEDWKKEWQEVLEIIKIYKPNLPGINQDEDFINQQLTSGNVVVHHSLQFEKTHHPHYRIIHKTIFEAWRELLFPVHKPIQETH